MTSFLNVFINLKIEAINLNIKDGKNFLVIDLLQNSF